MIKNSYISIALFCVMFVSCQVKPKLATDNDWTLQELNGRVSKITEYVYNLKTEDTTRQEIVFDTSGMIVKRSFFRGDSLTRQFVYGDSMKYEINGSGEIQWIVYITKNDKGQVVDEYVQSPTSEDRITYYDYDEKGHVVSERVENDEQVLISATEYKYDGNGLLRVQTEIDGYGTVSLITQYQYNKYGKPLEIGLYNSDNLCVQRQKYTYDANRETDCQYIDAYGNVFYSSHTEYKKKLPVSKHCLGTNIYEQVYEYQYIKGVLKSETISEYDSVNGARQLVILTRRTCDLYGNWTDETVIEPDVSMQPSIITHRQIEYYGN